VQDRERWDRISQWRGGARQLVIIDEALANVVESNKATASHLTAVSMSIPHELRQRFPDAIATLERMKTWLIAKETGEAGGGPELLWNAGSETVISELKLLKEALQDVAFDPRPQGRGIDCRGRHSKT
jgi:hypothetical protein